MDSWFWTESVGPVLFSAEYLICRHVWTDRQTDRQTDKLIWGGLGNLRFLQVNGTSSGKYEAPIKTGYCKLGRVNFLILSRRLAGGKNITKESLCFCSYMGSYGRWLGLQFWEVVCFLSVPWIPWWHGKRSTEKSEYLAYFIIRIYGSTPPQSTVY